MTTIRIVNEKFSTIVIFRFAQKERRGKIRADRVPTAAQGVIDMGAKGHPGFVTVEQRRENPAWQRGADEKRVP